MEYQCISILQDIHWYSVAKGLSTQQIRKGHSVS